MSKSPSPALTVMRFINNILTRFKMKLSINKVQTPKNYEPTHAGYGMKQMNGLTLIFKSMMVSATDCAGWSPSDLACFVWSLLGFSSLGLGLCGLDNTNAVMPNMFD